MSLHLLLRVLLLAAIIAVVPVFAGRGEPAGAARSQPLSSPATALDPSAVEGLPDAARPDAFPPRELPSRPGGAFGFSHYVFEQVGDRVITTLVEGPRAGQVRSSLSYLELKRIYQEGGPPPEGLQMSREELGKLVGQLDTVRAGTEKYRDVEVALADGYVNPGEEFPNMGAHFYSMERIFDGKFDPARPEMLLYSQREPGQWELVGTAFILPVHQVGANHPAAFSGPLDNWHVHYSVCGGGPELRTLSATREECEKLGGTWLPYMGWMIHAYVWVDNPLGVFHMWNPNIPPVASPDALRQAVSAELPQQGEATLSIENFSFPQVEVKAGETVVWTNADGVPHTITQGSRGLAAPGFDSGLSAPGQSFARRFDQPGQFSYTCLLHPSMNATVTVTE